MMKDFINVTEVVRSASRIHYVVTDRTTAAMLIRVMRTKSATADHGLKRIRGKGVRLIILLVFENKRFPI